MTKYTYRTDGVAVDTEYATEKQAIAAAVDSGDWPTIDSQDERRVIRDGGWLCVYEDGVPETVRGEMP